MPASEYPRVHLKTVAELRAWLRANHRTERGLWLVQWRSATGKPAIAYEDAVEEALCWGWIDSVVKPLDDERTMALYTPRKAGSGWSRTNKERIARLVKEKRMQPPGQTKIDAAKRDGSWALLDSVEALEVPADLRKALAAAKLTKPWDALTPGKKKLALMSLVTAKTPETRAKRVAEVTKSLRA